MKERPILFSAPMVRAILDGTKTQTRRVVKPQPSPAAHTTCYDGTPMRSWWETGKEINHCPYGQPGDRLYVRETWRYDNWTEDGEPFVRYAADGWCECRDVPEHDAEKVGQVWADLSDTENYEIDGAARDRRWRPSIHMPRWASRITLEVTGVRVERLHSMSDDDALAEGIDTQGEAYNEGENLQSAGSYVSPERYAFATLWRSINGDASWESNPWVWVIEFRRTTPRAA